MISSKKKPKYKKWAEFAEATHTVTSIYQPDIPFKYEIDETFI